MKDEKVWIGGGACGALLLAGLAWVAVIHPELSSTASVNGQTADAQTQNVTLQTDINKLKTENAGLGKLTAQLAEAHQAIPATSGIPALTRQLNSQAQQAGVTLSQITVGSPSLNTAAGAASTATGPAGQLYQMPITLAVAGPTASLQQFLNKVQDQGPRRALVSSVQLSPTGSGGLAAATSKSSMNISMTVFVTPETAAAQAALQKQLAGS